MFALLAPLPCHVELKSRAKKRKNYGGKGEDRLDKWKRLPVLKFSACCQKLYYVHMRLPLIEIRAFSQPDFNRYIPFL